MLNILAKYQAIKLIPLFKPKPIYFFAGTHDHGHGKEHGHGHHDHHNDHHEFNRDYIQLRD